MSGGKKKGVVVTGGTDRYTDSWSKAGKPTMGLDRADDHFLDKQGWSTSTQGLDLEVETSTVAAHQVSFYRPVASRQAAYVNYGDWQTLATHKQSEDPANDNGKNSAKKDKSKKGAKSKR